MHVGRALIVWVVVLVSVAGFLAWVGYWAVAVYFLRFECENVVLQEAISSNGQYIATAFERNCGATTGFERIFSVRATKDSCIKNGIVSSEEGRCDSEDRRSC